MPLKTQLEEPSINLTPMVDVLFLLIIFFMLGTKFTELERKISVQVPQVSDVSTLAPAPERRVINVYRDGRLTLDRQPVTIEQLQEELSRARAQYEELGVIVRGDADGPFQNVATVLSTCRNAGISEMGISVRLAGGDEGMRR